VQGAGAEDGIAAALRRVVAAGVDVVALVRGGGSRTDLATFDAEVVARTIAALGVPVLTGLGHEIDRAVADEVARLALKTPTAVAGWLIDTARAHHDAAEAAWRAVARQAEAHLQRDNRELVALGRRLSARTHTVVGRADERLGGHTRRLGRTSRQLAADATRHVDRAAARIEGSGRRHLDVGGRQLDVAAVRLASRAPRSLADAGRHLRTLDARRAALDPARTLARGWSITRTSDGRLVRSVADVTHGDELLTTVSDGTTRSRVEGSSP
jgi:exodeoxyribonuclease VII large subunit